MHASAGVPADVTVSELMRRAESRYQFLLVIELTGQVSKCPALVRPQHSASQRLDRPHTGYIAVPRGRSSSPISAGELPSQSSV